jgi:hypothetical protein
MKPEGRETKKLIFKGLDSPALLEQAFWECMRQSGSGQVWVETDMRAQFNPSRMEVIRELSEKFAERLASHCPQCESPGWGQVSVEKGLPCSDCGTKTEMIRYAVWGCTQCDYQEKKQTSEGLKEAEPKNCQYCNP